MFPSDEFFDVRDGRGRRRIGRFLSFGVQGTPNAISCDNRIRSACFGIIGSYGEGRCGQKKTSERLRLNRRILLLSLIRFGRGGKVNRILQM